MAKYNCEVCGIKFNDEEKEVTNCKSKCILHCEKTEENGWYKKNLLDKEWNKTKVNKFWKVIQDKLNTVYEDSFYEDWVLRNEYILEEIIFPKFEEEYEYDEFTHNIVDLGTNFYSFSIFEHPNNGQEDELNKIFDKLHVVFKNCIFEDSADFKKYQFSNEIKFNNCTFNSDIHLPESLSVSFDQTKFYNQISLNNLLAIYPETRSIFNECEFLQGCKFNEYTTIEAHIFRNCKFNEGIFGRNILFKKKVFNHGWNFVSTEYGKQGFYNIKHIKLGECVFEDDFILNDDLDVNLEYSLIKFKIYTLELHRSIFKKSFKLINSEISLPYLISVRFEGLVDLTNSILGIENSDSILDYIIFSFVEFKDIVKFNNVSFLTKTNFNGAIFFDSNTFINCKFSQSLNFENTIFKVEGNFLNIQGELENRETARIIKNALDKNDNIIEANKYYALELKKQEIDLNWISDFSEKLIFKFHKISSNHSQDWLLVLLWILNITFVYSAYTQELCLDEKVFLALGVYCLVLPVLFIEYCAFLDLKGITKFLIYGIYILFGYCIYGFLTCDFALNCVSSDFNPFSIMTKGETLTFGTLLFKVIIAYLIYQFIVSVRQNTRRK